MATGYSVFSGADKEAIRAHFIEQKRQELLLLSGNARRRVFVSGGSDTRRGVFEHYRSIYTPLGIKVEYFGWCVLIGGAS